MTLENILTYAELKGYESQRHLVEAIPGYTKELVGYQITGKHVWHWFTKTTFEATEKHEASVHVRFDHSYSMNTGRTKRGLAHRLRIEEKITQYLAKVAA